MSCLPITADIAFVPARLPAHIGDPFDRMIAAHALAEDIPVISADRSWMGLGCGGFGESRLVEAPNDGVPSFLFLRTIQTAESPAK